MDLIASTLPTPLVSLDDALIQRSGISLFMKRDDLIHPMVSGNKWRKLKYALADMVQQGSTSMLTFGGAYSNHLYAVAAAGKLLGVRTIGIVRGDELVNKERSSTLAFCESQGMELYFVSRETYRQREDVNYLNELSIQFNRPYILPEGGTSLLALDGVGELALEVKSQLGHNPDFYAVAAGSGGTAAGLLAAGQRVLAFPVLKGGQFLENSILQLAGDASLASFLSLFTNYHFGGYGRWDQTLIDFILDFRTRFQIPLEQIYTGKMMYGLYHLIEQGYFEPGSTVVAVHTGGLQGMDKALQ